MRRSAAVRTLTIAAAVFLAAGGLTCLRAQDPDDAKRGVARISLINGDVSLRRGDSGDWVAAAVNAPVLAQDHVSTGPNSRTEVQFDWANMLRIGANAEVNVAQLEYRRYMIQVSRGTTTFRVLRDSNADVEIDTPSVSVRPTKRGVYRVTVLEDGSSEITVRSGDVEVFTPRGSQRLASGQTMEARGTTSEPEFQIVRAIPGDDWDRWNEHRDRDLERTSAYRYVSRDIYGVEDLDPYGTWIYDAPYGYVWRPTVVVGWAPYRMGRWAWVDWYGWTWVSYDPWGWAPYHYGRWYDSGRGWCWYPGGIGGRHYWSPALVAFFGFGRGVHVGIGVGGGWGNVGWVPLAPHERFSPWWGRSYYGGYRNSTYIDRSVNITNNVNITNVYRNARVTNGVTAVNAGDFSRGRFNNPVRVDSAHLRDASLSRGIMPAAPGDAHLRYSDRQVQNVPSGAGNTRFFSRRQPEAVSRVSFAEQRQSLERVSRVPAGERASAPAVAANPTSPARSERNAAGRDNRGFRPAPAASAPTASNAAAASPRTAAPARNEGRGWRRFGDSGGSAPSAAVPAAGSVPAATPGRGGNARPAASAPAASAPSRNENRGWRRFGEPSATPSAAPASPSAPASRAPSAAPGRDENRNWRRFGEPGTSAPASPSPGSSAPSRNEYRSTPRRIESPAPTAGSGDYGRRYEPSRNSERSAPRETQRYSAPQRQESIRINPPVVRERAPQQAERPSARPSAPARSSESYSRPSGSSPARGSGGESRGGRHR